MKKLVSVAIVSLLVGGLAFAAGPKVSGYVVQMNEGDSYNGALGASKIYTSNGATFYNRSEVQGQATFDLGSGMTLTPWLKDRLEFFQDSGVDRTRNRYYVGADFAMAIAPAFNIVVTAEYRNANDFKTTSATTTAADSLATTYQQRFVPYLTIKGAVADLYYSLTEDLPIYFDTINNGSDDTQVELESTLNVGYNIKVSNDLTIKIDLNDSLDINFPKASDSVNKAKYENNTRDKVIFVMGDFKPFIGFLMSTTINGDTINSLASNIVGATTGFDIAVGNLSFGTVADLGYDVQNNNQIATALMANVKVKF